MITIKAMITSIQTSGVPWAGGEAGGPDSVSVEGGVAVAARTAPLGVGVGLPAVGAGVPTGVSTGDGDALGGVDGALDGEADGAAEGEADGTGEADGFGDGEGDADGALDGDGDGLAEGDGVGGAVGQASATVPPVVVTARVAPFASVRTASAAPIGRPMVEVPQAVALNTMSRKS